MLDLPSNVKVGFHQNLSHRVTCTRVSQTPREVAFQHPAAGGAWRAAGGLLLHRHAWVRAASARLLGSALADHRIGEPPSRAVLYLWANTNGNISFTRSHVKNLEIDESCISCRSDA